MGREKLDRKLTFQPVTGSEVDIPARGSPVLHSTPKEVEGALTRLQRGRDNPSQCSNLAPEDMKSTSKHSAPLTCLPLNLLCWRADLKLLPTQGNRDLK